MKLSVFELQSVDYLLKCLTYIENKKSFKNPVKLKPLINYEGYFITCSFFYNFHSGDLGTKCINDTGDYVNMECSTSNAPYLCNLLVSLFKRVNFWSAGETVTHLPYLLEFLLEIIHSTPCDGFSWPENKMYAASVYDSDLIFDVIYLDKDIKYDLISLIEEK